MALLTRGSRNNSQTEKGEDEQREAEVLDPWHVVRRAIDLYKLQRLLFGVLWSCSRKKSNLLWRLDLFAISWMHLGSSNQKCGHEGLRSSEVNGGERVGGTFEEATQLR